MSQRSRRRGGRLARTLRALATIGTLGIVLMVYSAITTQRDVALATGPRSDAQRQFLVDAAERPDVTTFFKKLPHRGRLRMAEAIGAYDHPKLAKLAALCLGDFDAEAREVLTASLTKLAQTQTAAVAAELKQKGSFQSFGVFAALRNVGPRALPEVAAQLKENDARGNAATFLVANGSSSAPHVRPFLRDENKDVRLAAAEILGKIGDSESYSSLLSLFEKAPMDERNGYLTALASLGNPSARPLFAEILGDTARPLPERAQAALGLGRIGSVEAASILWQHFPSPEPVLEESARTALALCGDTAFETAPPDPRRRVLVAQNVGTPRADQVLRDGISSPDFSVSLAATRAARGRATVVDALLRRVETASPDANGELIDAVIAALDTTERGRQWLDQNASTDPALRGLVARRQALAQRDGA